MTDTVGEVVRLPASVETVYTPHSITGANSQSSSSTVSVVKLDWESVSDSDLTALAANVDSIIATGTTRSSFTLLVNQVLVLPCLYYMLYYFRLFLCAVDCKKFCSC